MKSYTADPPLRSRPRRRLQLRGGLSRRHRHRDVRHARRLARERGTDVSAARVLGSAAGVDRHLQQLHHQRARQLDRDGRQHAQHPPDAERADQLGVAPDVDAAVGRRTDLLDSQHRVSRTGRIDADRRRGRRACIFYHNTVTTETSVGTGGEPALAQQPDARAEHRAGDLQRDDEHQRTARRTTTASVRIPDAAYSFQWNVGRTGGARRSAGRARRAGALPGAVAPAACGRRRARCAPAGARAAAAARGRPAAPAQSVHDAGGVCEGDAARIATACSWTTTSSSTCRSSIAIRRPCSGSTTSGTTTSACARVGGDRSRASRSRTSTTASAGRRRISARSSRASRCRHTDRDHKPSLLITKPRRTRRSRKD